MLEWFGSFLKVLGIIVIVCCSTFVLNMICAWHYNHSAEKKAAEDALKRREESRETWQKPRKGVKAKKNGGKRKRKKK